MQTAQSLPMQVEALPVKIACVKLEATQSVAMKPDISSFTLLKQGAEAKIYTGEFLGRPTVVKERFSKKYRHPVLDKSLTSQRTKSEVRSIMRCRTSGRYRKLTSAGIYDNPERLNSRGEI